MRELPLVPTKSPTQPDPPDVARHARGKVEALTAMSVLPVLQCQVLRCRAAHARIRLDFEDRDVVADVSVNAAGDLLGGKSFDAPGLAFTAERTHYYAGD